MGLTAVPPILRGADATPASDLSRAVLAVTPRTGLPPEADDSNRPRNVRLLKPGVWVDDVGVDDNGNIYNQYRRSSFGTWSNYDEAIANPFPLTDPLVAKNGQPVKDAATWWSQRRPEILGDFYTEIYGRMPESLPKVTWEVTAVNESGAVRTKTIVGHIDNSAYPEAVPAGASQFLSDRLPGDMGGTPMPRGTGVPPVGLSGLSKAEMRPAPAINLTLTLPANASGPVPVMVVVSSAPTGAPQRAATTGAGNAPSSAAPAAAKAGRAAAAPARGPTGPSPMQQVLDRGWGYATFNTASVQADNGGGLTQGIIGLMNRGQPRSRPDEWGALTAWTWGLSRVIDYFETDRDVDAKRLGVEGHSRWGKTALWAAAQDQRWAIVFTSCSGEGGAKPSRRNFGETTDNIAGSHWMAAAYRKYGGHWNDLPVDAPELIALVAPRPAFITGATQDPWADPRGEFLAAVTAGPVYRLLGKKDLGTTEMPAPDVALVSGDVAFREHVGPHTDLHDWPVFLDYAARYFGTPAAKAPAN
jgi:hypothetical protein